VEDCPERKQGGGRILPQVSPCDGSGLEIGNFGGNRRSDDLRVPVAASKGLKDGKATHVALTNRIASRQKIKVKA